MNNIWHKTLFVLHETPITFISLFIAAAALLISFMMAQGIKRGMERAGLFKKHGNKGMFFGMTRLIYYLILFIGFYISLSIIGIDLTGIAVIAGALTVGIGFGLQTIINNFIAGMIILVEKKVRPNDMIQLESGDIGYVIEIKMRHTLIHTLDHRKIIIPNNELISRKIINWTLNGDGNHRIRTPFSVDRKCDKEEVRRIALSAAKKIPFLAAKNLPEVWLNKLTESEQEFELVLWIDHFKHKEKSISITGTILATLEATFAQEGMPLKGGARFFFSPSPLQEL